MGRLGSNVLEPFDPAKHADGQLHTIRYRFATHGAAHVKMRTQISVVIHHLYLLTNLMPGVHA